MDCGSCKLMILIIYRIRYSSKDSVTTATFSEDFTHNNIMSPEPLLMTGDFNIHTLVYSDIKHTRLLG